MCVRGVRVNCECALWVHLFHGNRGGADRRAAVLHAARGGAHVFFARGALTLLSFKLSLSLVNQVSSEELFVEVQEVMAHGDLDDEFLPAILRVAEYSYFMEQVGRCRTVGGTVVT